MGRGWVGLGLGSYIIGSPLDRHPVLANYHSGLSQYPMSDPEPSPTQGLCDLTPTLPTLESTPTQPLPTLEGPRPNLHLQSVRTRPNPYPSLGTPNPFTSLLSPLLSSPLLSLLLSSSSTRQRVSVFSSTLLTRLVPR